MKDGYGYRSEQRLRKENQDTFGVFELPIGTLVVVCDGMGGHVGGAQASALAVRTLYDTLAEAQEGDRRGALKRAIESANRVIYETARKNYRLTGMGTTCVAALVDGAVVHVAHVGDSRAYLMRRGEIRQLTRDHTMVNLFVDAELLAPEDAASHPEAHVLSRSLGVERHVEVDLQPPLTLEAGDRLMLSSDGVHGVIGASSFTRFDGSSPQKLADEAVKAVEAAQGDDNATIVVFARDFQGASSPATEPPDAAALSEAAAEPVVRPLGGHGMDGGPEDDVAPIEDLDDLASAFAPKIGPHAQTREQVIQAQQSSIMRAVVALGALAFVGTMFAIKVFVDQPQRPAPLRLPEPTSTQVAASDPAQPGQEPATNPAAANPAVQAPGLATASTRPAQAPVNDPSTWVDVSPLADGGTFIDTWTGDGMALVVDPTAFRQSGGGHDDVLLFTSGGLAVGSSGDAWAPPPRCLDCTRSLARPSSSAYLHPEGRESLVGAFFRPSIPQAPQRAPITPSRYAESAPRGPAQATAIRHARSKECREAMEVVDGAMVRSVDNAVLYRTAWICFNEADQLTLTSANASTFKEFRPLEQHFRGSMPPLTPPDANPLTYPWSWEAAPTGGIEYRIDRYVRDQDIRGLQDVMADMVGEPSLADQLGVDVLLEATAAAAASRADSVDPALIDMWARRVYYGVLAMNGTTGELIRRNRPDLSDLIETLLFEATGGDAGATAIAEGLPNTYVPT
ncbi:MAG TPA: protein phosphatase 2C domain-containing protein, partial [Myxococcota bacterium]|nr:protein phosphatase 2C domain-containing protein [Myxococcota bacterium]